MEHASATGGVKMAIASAVGVGIGFILYRMYNNKSSDNGRGKVAVPVNNKGITHVQWRMEGQRVLVIGGDDEAAKRVAFASTAGAYVIVVAPSKSLTPTMKRLLAPPVSHRDRTFSYGDLEGIDLVMCCDLAPPTSPEDLSSVCRRMRIPANFSNAPHLCDFWVVYRDQAVRVDEPTMAMNSVIPKSLVDGGKDSPSVRSTTEMPTLVAEDLLPEINDFFANDEIPSILAGVFDGYTASKYVATALNEIFYDFSYSEESSHFEYVPRVRAKDSKLNCFGQSVKDISLDTRTGCGGAMYGSLLNGSAVGAFMGADSLLEFVPTLYKLSREGYPVVMHVAAQDISPDDLSISVDYSNIVAIQHTGCAIIASNSVQECHDIALITQLASNQACSPFVHFFDGLHTARDASKINILSHQAIHKVVQEEQISQAASALSPDTASNRASHLYPHSHSHSHSHTRSKSRANVPKAVDAAMERMSAALGRRYRLFEYSGSADAEHVLVTLGPSDPLLPFANASASSEKAGVLAVRLLRPWSAEHFLSAVPATVKRVSVVMGDEHSEMGRMLMMDVAASFHSHHWALPFPLIHSVSMSDIITGAGFGAPAPATAERSDIWSTANDNILQEGIMKVLARSELSASLANSSSIFLPDGSDSVKTVTSTRVAYGRSIPSSVDAVLSSFVFCYDHTLLSKYNVLGSIKNGGTFVLNCPWTPEELETSLPPSIKRTVAQRQLKFYAFDASKLAIENDIGDSPVSIFQAAFFAHSSAMSMLSGKDDLISLVKKTKAADSTLIHKILRIMLALQPVPIPTSWVDVQETTATELPSVPKQQLHLRATGSTTSNSANEGDKIMKGYIAARYLMFPEAYQVEKRLRPDVQGAHLVKVTLSKRLTPDDYERNVFHLEMDISNTTLKYDIGEALGVHSHNDDEEVKEFLSFYKLNPDDIISMGYKGSEGKVHVRTAKQVFTQYLDIFGRPSKAFYQSLAEYATNPSEKERLQRLTSPEGQEDFKQRVANTVTFADLLMEFPSAHPPVEDLLQIVPPIKPRHYSIASSIKAHPDSVHLLVVLVDWVTPAGKKRYGHATRYLANLREGQSVTVTVKPSVMTLPPLDTQPVLMAGLGTGMAPFRAFIQERAFLKAQGVEVGPMVLYFGSRSRFAEYLYGEEIEAYHKEGLLTHIGLAFSRDQPQKIYIQHKIKEDTQMVWDFMVPRKGHFYLCGPTWPEPDVKAAILDSFVTKGGLDMASSEKLLDQLKDDERYILELY